MSWSVRQAALTLLAFCLTIASVPNLSVESLVLSTPANVEQTDAMGTSVKDGRYLSLQEVLKKRTSGADLYVNKKYVTITL